MNRLFGVPIENVFVAVGSLVGSYMVAFWFVYDTTAPLHREPLATAIYTAVMILAMICCGFIGALVSILPMVLIDMFVMWLKAWRTKP